MKDSSIQITEKPDWVTWEEIHEVLWKAHEQNREKGMNMAFPALPGEEIRKKIEGNGTMLVALSGGRVIGTAAILIKKKNIWCGNGNYAYCCLASVLTEYNGLGIYKRLNLERERIAKEMGMDKMIFDTHENNKRIIKGDLKAGYRIVDIVVCKDHYNVVMVKWLNGCPFSDLYIKWQFLIHKFYRKLRFKPGSVKRFGI